MIALLWLMLCGMSLQAVTGKIELTHDYSVIKNGDLLFVASEKGNAITSVTQGVNGLAIDHVGIAWRDDNNTIKVIEAVPWRGVCITPIDSFMRASTPSKGNVPLVIVGRLKDTTGVALSVQRALRYVGRPYDNLFMHDDQEIYCSELVMLSYVNSSGGQRFAPIRMSFHDNSGLVTKFWHDYYSRRGMSVPEGAQGSNPGALSRDPQVAIIYRFF